MINIGPLAIQAGGLILIVSLWLGTWLTDHFSKHLGTNGEGIENSILIGLLAGLLSARIGFSLQNISIFLENPLSLLALSPSMLNIPFGLLIGTLGALIFAQKKSLPLYPTLDTLSPLMLIVFTGIQLANLATGNIYGLPTDLPWAIDIWGAERHPPQVYAIILSLGVFLGLMIHTKRLTKTGFMRSGVLFNLTLAGLAMITIFSRAFVENKAFLVGIDAFQILSFGLLILSFTSINQLAFQPRKHIAVLISMGSNQSPKINLSKAILRLKSDLKVRRFSHLYKTQDAKNPDTGTEFINQLMEIETSSSFPDLRAYLKSIEREFGRAPGNKQVVPLDLDVLTYDKDVFAYQEDRIPDPELLKYRYIAQPLAEILPDFRHPGNGKSIKEILNHIENNIPVKMIEEEIDGITK
jgi:phosphatidylglycerol:prolipoprotein diacylglycerol transferase